jgi:hypothetical protein
MSLYAQNDKACYATAVPFLFPPYLHHTEHAYPRLDSTRPLSPEGQPATNHRPSIGVGSKYNWDPLQARPRRQRSRRAVCPEDPLPAVDLECHEILSANLLDSIRGREGQRRITTACFNIGLESSTASSRFLLRGIYCLLDLITCWRYGSLP